MNVEFIEALNELCKTRRIKKEVLLEAIEQALMSAYKKNFDSASNARVTLDAIARSGGAMRGVNRQAEETDGVLHGTVRYTILLKESEKIPEMEILQLKSNERSD